MSQLTQLLNQLPHDNDIHMSTMGQVLWVCWQGTLPHAVNQTLLNYGGMLVKEGNHQALWFFFTDDVFLALARLRIWGNFNDMAVAIEVFAGRLQLNNKREPSLGIEGILGAQELFARESLDIFVHPSSREGKSFIPGITFDRAAMRQGMAAADWQSPVVDQRLPYSSSQSWFIVFHPLGNPLDKNFQSGWSAMFNRLEALFQELKVKFIVQDGFVTASMENLLMLRTFLRKYLEIFDKEKRESGAYWPTVSVISDRKNLNFNSDLPKRVAIKYDSLMPDVPYLSYRNAFLLGNGFVIRDLRFTSSQTSMDTWCNALLDENNISSRTIPLVMSAQLADTGETQECFYCGLSNHSAAECPTRNYFPSSPEAWQSIARLDLDGINAAFRQIELVLSAKDSGGFSRLLETESPAQAVLKGIFEINAPAQLRNVARNWLYRMKEPDPDEEQPQKDESQAWELLEKFKRTPPARLDELEKEVTTALSRGQRDHRLRMLRAFIRIEKNDYAGAMGYFKEAAAITPTPSLQAWNEYLQGRMLEAQGKYAEASSQYSQVLRVMPHWKDVVYRGLVCRVKMGFGEQVLDQAIALVRSEPEFFNRFLIDPALERGRLLILSALFDMLEESKKNAIGERGALAAIGNRLDAWFPQDHPVQARLGDKVSQLSEAGAVDNYMAFFLVSRARPALEKDLNESIQREVDELKNRYKSYLDVLEEIRDEASWFPFPSALKDFSADFNKSAGIINWAFSSNFGEAEVFKKAQANMPELDRLLHNLKQKLNFLRVVRDATLFGLTMFKTFIWIEIAGLLLCFLGVPAIVFFGEKMGLGWLKYLIGENQWAIQKVLLVIITIMAIGLGALRTTLSFDRKREKLLEEARKQREKAQATRLATVKKKRAAEAQRLAQQKAEMEKKEAKRRMGQKMES